MFCRSLATAGCDPPADSARPGDYIIVPSFVPHREGNPAPDVEAIVVNLDEPAWPVG